MVTKLDIISNFHINSRKEDYADNKTFNST